MPPVLAGHSREVRILAAICSTAQRAVGLAAFSAVMMRASGRPRNCSTVALSGLAVTSNRFGTSGIEVSQNHFMVRPRFSMKHRAAGSRGHWLAGTTITLPGEGQRQSMHRRLGDGESILVNRCEAPSVRESHGGALLLRQRQGDGPLSRLSSEGRRESQRCRSRGGRPAAIAATRRAIACDLTPLLDEWLREPTLQSRGCGKGCIHERR